MPEIGQIQKREITDEVKESYLDYAMSVIVSRALPDVRDGLKPVHRRILYVMHEMGLSHAAKFRKCAAVVGECFVKNTFITTSRGLVPIQDVVFGDYVFTQNGLEPVTCLYKMPPKPLYKVTLSNGVTVTVTKSQKLKTFNQGRTFEWKEAKDLRIGEWLVIKTSFPELKEVILSNYRNRPKTLNRNIAYILGMLISDGWISADYGMKKNRRLSFCSNESSIMKKLVRCFKEEFQYSPKIEIKEYELKRSDANIIHNRLYILRVNRKEINDYIIRELGIAQDFKAATKYIPRKILASPKEIIFSFVSGLIDGDGSIAREDYPKIVYASVSEQLIDQLQIVLQCLGIFSKKYSQKRIKCGGLINGHRVQSRAISYTLEINGIEAQKLAYKLNLASEAKNRWLKTIINADPARLWSNFGSIPFGSQIIFSELSKFHLGGGWYLSPENNKKFRMGIYYPGGGKIRYSTDLVERPLRLRQVCEFGIAEKLKKINSPLSDFIESLIKNEISFLQVHKIQSAQAEETYDLQVAKDHEFVANGIISHNCLGKYHPHGDMAVYDALARMAQDFSLRYPLIDGQGNFGSQDGDNAAAQRYTECRLTKIAEELLSDIEKDTVDFTDNYDATRKEPKVLPSKIPQLLLNGTVGIAVGMATYIPPHNLSEVCDAMIYLIEHPKCDSEDLLQFIKGPDFPTGGEMYGKSQITEAYSQGKGSILVRGKAEIVEEKKGKTQIIISEIPYQVIKSSLIEQMAELVKEKRIDGVRDIRDESDKEGLRIVIDLKSDAFPQKALNALYKFTELQKTFHLNMLALAWGIQPEVLSLKQVLEYFIEHRKNIVRRRTEFDLFRARERAHILEGLNRAMDKIDAVIKTIKQSQSREDAHKNLKVKFKFTDIQANAILEMKLQALARLERQKIEDELKEKAKIIKEYALILREPKRILRIINEETRAVKEKYGDERKTKVFAKEAREISEVDLIPQEEIIVSLTHGGYIKRVKPEVYKIQKRGGKGIIGMTTLSEDVVSHFFSAMTHDNLLFFTNKGRVFQTPAYEIPEGTRVSRGRALVNFLSLESQEQVTAILPFRKEGEAKYLVMATRKGLIKKTPIGDFENVRRSGLIAIRLKKDDILEWVEESSGGDDVMLVTQKGKSIRFSEKNVRPMGRPASGVKGIRSRAGDEVISMVIVSQGVRKPVQRRRSPERASLRRRSGSETAGSMPRIETEFLARGQEEVLIVTENGYGKKSSLKQFRIQGRGGSGIIAGKITDKTGKIAGARMLFGEEEDLIVISQKGQVIRTLIKDIPTLGRATQGVRIMKLEPGDKVASTTCI